MKKILSIASIVLALALNSQAQGLVSISVTAPVYFVSTQNLDTGAVGKIIGTGINGYFFELLTSQNLSISSSANNITIPSNLAQWTDTGVFGQSFGSSLNAGKISASFNGVANGWAAPSGASYDDEQAYMIVGWSGNLGTTYSQFLNSLQYGYDPYGGGYLGYTPVSYNYAGGGPASLLSVNLWGNQTGTPGFGNSQALILYGVPEPGIISMAAFGGLSLLVFRRKK